MRHRGVVIKDWRGHCLAAAWDKYIDHALDAAMAEAIGLA